MGGPGWSLSFGESATWAGRQRFRDLGCCPLGKRGEDMGASVLGSCKEGGDDLFSLSQENTAGPPGVGDKITGKESVTGVLASPHCISVPFYKMRGLNLKVSESQVHSCTACIINIKKKD